MLKVRGWINQALNLYEHFLSVVRTRNIKTTRSETVLN